MATQQHRRDDAISLSDASATTASDIGVPDTISERESNIRSYVRLFPTVFETAKGSVLTDHNGREFIDFFCGAGTLNYGHNNDRAKAALLDYISRDGIQHSLDTATGAKIDFLRAFEEKVLAPRHMDYKIQFTGPTGTNAVEAAIKLARKVTGRSHVIAFTHAYHGHTLGALALTANSYYHHGSYGAHQNVSHLPFDGYLPGVDSSAYLARILDDKSSGTPLPAAIILETIQGEGGVNVASADWLQNITRLCRQHDIVLIVDDIQVGNGRTGQYFSFEFAGITPDIVCLSKSLGGGMPIAINLIKPALDQWGPGEHTGTFRGNNLAFVAATALLTHWDDDFTAGIRQRGQRIAERLQAIVSRHPTSSISYRGRGMIWGLDVGDGDTARAIIDRAFDAGLLMEASGANDEVLKVMAALTIPEALLEQGLDILDAAVDATLSQST